MTISKKDNSPDIIKVIKEAVREVFREEDVITRKDLEYLPTKEEFYKREDEIMGELKTMREELQMLSNRVYQDHDLRIEQLEKIHPNYQHTQSN